MKNTALTTLVAIVLFSCSTLEPKQEDMPTAATYASLLTEKEANTYIPVTLTTDTSVFSEEDRNIIPLLLEAGAIMDELFWKEAYGDKYELLNAIADEDARTYAMANYGPWDRLNDNAPFLSGIGEKPAGAQFYPADMTKEEFEAWDNPFKSSLYTMVRRDSTGALTSIFYHEYFKDDISRAASLLREASKLTTNASFSFYLEERAKALETDRYNASDIAWLNLTDNTIDVVIGPIENYEDHLYAYKAAHECYILVKDREWSQRLERYSTMLPALQKELPCDEKYKQDAIGSNAQLNAYDVIFYAGDCNAGSKTIAVNLPNDEEIQQQYGTRRSQLKNAMRAKFDKILIPLADVLIADNQRQHITFDAFFGNTMFHEVAHGLGIKNTISGKGTVREALKEESSALEEGKADILGLWMVSKLYEMGEINEGVVMDNYVTFLAGIFRSVRFGASSAHGKANMLRFNYFREAGAFSRDETSGKYSVNTEAMADAVQSLSALILSLQGEGDYEGVQKLMSEKGFVDADLQKDLDRLQTAQIPVDVIFNQGASVLGLQ